ncbi:hypothetical protein [Bacillus sp. B1-b2]|uniref:hypothetical protein n=1 Tax=Bacillus sp. B1-b2 TaxID=2653201 RepID=UPI001D033615|nr:hypothetical protein [Bacillus sp. B1-b2]
MQSSQYGIHEIADLREILNFKVASLAEAKARMQKVENEELKTIVQQRVKLDTNAVSEMKTILSKASSQIEE